MDLLRHVISILERVEQIFVNDENEVSNQAYKELLLEENQIESQKRIEIENDSDLDQSAKVKGLK